MPIPSIPDAMPTMGNRYSRGLGLWLLRLFGWQVRGVLPNEKKVMIVGAPHTSNWDFIFACGAILALGLRMSVMMKKEAFFWPVKGLLEKMGFIPLDRKKAQDVVSQTVSWYKEHDQCWIGIAPEGTRSKVDNWKSGFIRIAHAAEVPVLMVGLDFATKSIVLVEELFIPTGDHEADIATIRAYYDANFTARHPSHQ